MKSIGSVMKYVIELTTKTGHVRYFVGPSINVQYNPRIVTRFLDAAKMYDSMGHAVTTGKKVVGKYAVYSSSRVIEVSVTVSATGGVVVPKEENYKNGDSSKYRVSRPSLPSLSTTTKLLSKENV